MKDWLKGEKSRQKESGEAGQTARFFFLLEPRRKFTSFNEDRLGIFKEVPMMRKRICKLIDEIAKGMIYGNLINANGGGVDIRIAQSMGY